MDELLQLLLEEAKKAQGDTWYGEGSDATSDALVALMDVVQRVQYRLSQKEK